MKRVTLAVFLVVFCLAPATVQAKGNLSKAIITGSFLNSPVVVTDPTTLDAVDPFQAQFIDQTRGVRAAPPADDPRYRVEVYFEIFLDKDTGKDRLGYVFDYVPGKNGEAGWIYLPGKSDADFSLNQGTIIQGIWDGNWSYASPGWEQKASRILAANLPSNPGSVPIASSLLREGAWVLFGIGIVILFGVVLGGRAIFRALAPQLHGILNQLRED